MQKKAVLAAELRQKTEELVAALYSIQHTLEQEQEINSIRTELVTTVSHEFRTPLTIIKTSTQVLRKHYDKMDEEKRTMYHDNIQASVVRLVELTDRIVNIKTITDESNTQQMIAQLSS